MPVTVHAEAMRAADTDAIQRWHGIPAAVAIDVAAGRGQIDPAIRPLQPPGRQTRLFGRAVTALCEPPDFGAVLHAIDRVGRGEVLVIAAGGDAQTAMIGEILGGQLRRRGAAGLVCDGAIRDVGTLASWSDFSVFTRAVTPRGPTSGLLGAVNAPVVVGGALIHAGDLIIGDDDGLVAIDAKMLHDCIDQAEAKLRHEAEWQSSLKDGRSMVETFALEPARTVSAGGFA